MTPTYPIPGVCGACTRPAQQFPSGRWTHTGRPCAARSQSLWSPDDLDIRGLCRFIPDGDELPGADPGGQWTTTRTEHGVPVQLGWRSPGALNDQITRVRAELAAEAEGGDAS